MKSTGTLAAVIAPSFLFLCLLIGCCWALLFPIYGINGSTAGQGQERAVELIAALEEYKTDMGEFPSSLELIMPGYLPNVPQPAPGWQYQHEVQANGEELRLSFMLGRSLDGDHCEYTSITKHWQCSDLI